MAAYDESQDLIVQAEQASRAGRHPEARSLYGQAAALQRQLLEALPEGRFRTRSAVGLSAASLLWRAGDLAQAERLAHELMAQEWLEARARTGLQELLGRIWTQSAASPGMAPAGAQPLSLTLSGGSVTHGLAPADVVEHAVELCRRFLRRMAAWCVGDPFQRLPAGDTPEVERYRVLLATPVPGSYRLDFYVATAGQFGERPELPLEVQESPTPGPSDIIDTCLRFARFVREGNRDGVRDLVTQEEYRESLVRLVRSLVPDGRAVAEVELRPPEAPAEEAVRFRAPHRSAVTSLLHDVCPPPRRGDGERPLALRGVLMKVDLYTSVIEVTSETGRRRFKIPAVLDDVIGPMLNKPVKVTAHMPAGGRSTMGVADDVDLADEAAEDSDLADASA